MGLYYKRLPPFLDVVVALKKWWQTGKFALSTVLNGLCSISYLMNIWNENVSRTNGWLRFLSFPSMFFYFFFSHIFIIASYIHAPGPGVHGLPHMKLTAHHNSANNVGNQCWFWNQIKQVLAFQALKTAYTYRYHIHWGKLRVDYQNENRVLKTFSAISKRVPILPFFNWMLYGRVVWTRGWSAGALVWLMSMVCTLVFVFGKTYAATSHCRCRPPARPSPAPT